MGATEGRRGNTLKRKEQKRIVRSNVRKMGKREKELGTLGRASAAPGGVRSV